MAQLPKKRVLNLQRIFREEYGKKLSFSEATEAANNLVGFFDLLAEIDDENKENQNDHKKKKKII